MCYYLKNRKLKDKTNHEYNETTTKTNSINQNANWSKDLTVLSVCQRNQTTQAMILIVITFTAKTIHSPYRVAKSTTLTPLATSWIISILVCKEIFSTFLFFLDGLIWEPNIFLARQVKHNTNSAKRYCRFKIWTKIAHRDVHVF